MAHSSLVQLLVTAVMLPGFPQHDLLIMGCLRSVLDHASGGKFDYARSLIFPMWPPFDKVYKEHQCKYYILLSEFLGNPMRSQEFYVDGNKFAALATTLSTILFGLSMYVLPLSLTSPTVLTNLNPDQAYNPF